MPVERQAMEGSCILEATIQRRTGVALVATQTQFPPL
jgi:hypothetical protein